MEPHGPAVKPPCLYRGLFLFLFCLFLCWLFPRPAPSPWRGGATGRPSPLRRLFGPSRFGDGHRYSLVSGRGGVGPGVLVGWPWARDRLTGDPEHIDHFGPGPDRGGPGILVLGGEGLDQLIDPRTPRVTGLAGRLIELASRSPRHRYVFLFSHRYSLLDSVAIGACPNSEPEPSGRIADRRCNYTRSSANRAFRTIHAAPLRKSTVPPRAVPAPRPAWESCPCGGGAQCRCPPHLLQQRLAPQGGATSGRSL